MSNNKEPKKRDASDVYDRQIRLWGKESQEKMAKAKVLYIHVTGVTSEILKNLVLAGIRASICDNRKFPEAVAETPSFLLPPSATSTFAANENGKDDEPASKKQKFGTVGQAVKPVVEEMNLLLGATDVIDKDVSELDADTLNEFPIVIASHISPSEATRLANIVVNEQGHQFFMADCFGLYGASIVDLGANHQFRPEVGKKLLDPKPLQPHVPVETIFQIPLQDAVNRFHKQHPPTVLMRYRAILEYRDQTNAWPSAENADDFSAKIQAWIQSISPNLVSHEIFQADALKDLATIASAETAPVCAILGGMLGNEIIKAISGKGEPANNTVLFDGESCKAWTFLVKPK